MDRIPGTSPLHQHLASPSDTALIFSLRMLNLPLPLIPPMYKMLLTELKESKHEFERFILWGRGYRLEGSEEGMGLDLEPKRSVALCT